MSGSGNQAVLSELRRRVDEIERGERRLGAVLPFGLSAIDDALPGGGLPLGALHEARGVSGDEEDGAVAAAFLAGILARLDPGRPVLWCQAADDLYGPGLAAAGLGPERLIVARCRDDRERLWAMEEGLRSPALAAVLGEVGGLSLTAGRRLQLAAEASGVTGFVLNRWREAGIAARERVAASVASTRWQVATAAGDTSAGEPGVGRPRWRLDLLRCRGGVPGSWIVEACDATGHVRLATELADRPAAPQGRSGTGDVVAATFRPPARAPIGEAVRIKHLG